MKIKRIIELSLIVSLGLFLTQLSFGQSIKDSSCVVYLPFEEVKEGITPDKSKEGRIAKVYDVSQVEGKIGKGLYFNGKDSYVAVPHTEDNFVDTGLTYSAWIKPDNVSMRQVIMTGDYNGMQRLFLSEEGEVKFFIFIEGDWQCLISFSSVSPGKWYHIVATFDGKEVNLYVNGEIEDSKELKKRGRTWRYPKKFKEIRIGRWRDTPVKRYPFAGIIDEVRIYNRALDTSEINPLFGISANVAIGRE